MFALNISVTIPMQTIAEMPVVPAVNPDLASFPPFSLARLLRTVFAPPVGERVAILIDLKDPHQMKDYAFLNDPKLTIQRIAYEKFHLGLRDGVLAELGLTGGEMFAYKITGGSNLDLPDLAVDAEGHELSLERDIYPNYDLILCISTYSATAPLTAFAKRFGFRGATLHGVNDIILPSGLAVDYNRAPRRWRSTSVTARTSTISASNSADRKRKRATASVVAVPMSPICRRARCTSFPPARKVSSR